MAAPTALSDIYTRQFTLAVLRDEAIEMVHQGLVSRQQPLYSLCSHIPAREWPYVEAELERNDFLLRDRIIDLIGGYEHCGND